MKLSPTSQLLFSLCVLFTPPATPTMLTALPLGYEDTILCLSASGSACLRPYPRPHGWSGPRTAFVECCEPSTGEVSRPKGWGWRLETSYLEELLRQGWNAADQCTAEESEMCRPNKNKNSNGQWHGLAPLMLEMECAIDRLMGLMVTTSVLG
jgi:hypothetical protein